MRVFIVVDSFYSFLLGRNTKFDCKRTLGIYQDHKTEIGDIFGHTGYVIGRYCEHQGRHRGNWADIGQILGMH